MGSAHVSRAIWVVVVVGVVAGNADPLRPVLDVAPDTFVPAVLDQQRVGGILSDSLRANTEGYLEHVDPDREAAPYSSHAPEGAPARLAESAGWFLRAAGTAYEYTGDGNVKSRMSRVAAQLVAAQRPDGYLGTNPDGHSWKPDELPALVSNLNGLLAYSRVTGDEASLAASRRIGDLLTRTFYVDSVKHTLLGLPDWRSAPGSVGLIRPLVELYRATNDSRYLALAKGLASRLASVTTDPESRIVYASALVALYRLTGDANQLRAATADWKEVHDHHLAITGAPETGVPPRAAKTTRPALASACAVAEWSQLNLEMLRVTGEPAYAEELEQTTYNQLLGSQDRRTGEIDSYVQLSGTKNFSYDLGPCHAAASAAIAQIPNFAWGRYGEGIAVMSYTPGRVTLALRRRATVQIYTETDFPISGDVLLHIEPSHDIHFPLRLRVPMWAKGFQVTVGRSHLAGTPGKLLEIEREWKKGSTVRISFDLPVQMMKDEAQQNLVALQRGPQVLALSKDLNSDFQDLGTISVGAQTVSLKSVENRVDVLAGPSTQVYSFETRSGGESRPVLLAPFADASDYRVWLRHEGS